MMMCDADMRQKQAIGLLYRFLCRLMQEIDRLPDGKDIEIVHQARVATRRLRMALMALRGVLKPSDHKRWKKTVSYIGQTLGKIRDLDVQIQTVSSLVSRASPAAQPGLQRLRWRLKMQRKACRPSLQKLLRRLEKEKWAFRAKNGLRRAAHPDFCSTMPLASVVILEKIHAVSAYQRILAQPTPIEAEVLHTLRKIIRNLRYTLEIFDILSVTAPMFSEEISTLKSLQDILGDIHDCDVWIAYLPIFARKEQQKILEFSGNVEDTEQIETGIRWFANNRQIYRNRQYEMFIEQWRMLEKSGFLGKLVEKSNTYTV